jgi:hypothetical protein
MKGLAKPQHNHKKMTSKQKAHKTKNKINCRSSWKKKPIYLEMLNNSST